jgi:rod shape determining protein RodA
VAAASISERSSALRRFDYVLPAVVLTIAVGGVFAIHSATHSYLTDEGYPQKQAVGVVVGLAAMLVLAASDYAHLAGRIARPLYWINLAFLVLAIVHGHSSHGAQRWVPLGPIDFQPSELAKFAVIVCLSVFLYDRRAVIRDSKTVLTSIGYILAPILLILKQPDLGTALVILTVWLFMLFVGGARLRHLSFALVSGLVLFGLAWHTPLIKDYQKQRLTAFVNPAADPRDTGYHLHQSEIAIGSGGVTGKGYLQGTQANGHFIPEQHTDFIFTIVGEEGGFVGACLLIGLYALMIQRCIAVIIGCDDLLGRLIVSGVVGMFAFHIIVNIGMTIGAMPVTGVPLPFFSYGLSSLIAGMAAIGLVLSVGSRRERRMF